MSKIKKYLIFTFAITWLLLLFGIRNYYIESYGGMLAFSQTLALCMFIPSLGAFLAGADIREMGWKPNIRQNIRLILLAWLLPTVFQIIGAALYFLVFPGDFDASGKFLMERAPETYELLMRRGDSYIGFVAKIAVSPLFSLHIFVSMILGLGEEIGWRGFLFPALDERLGRTKGTLLGGVIHGAWHFPLMLTIGYEYGTDYIGAPVLGLFAFCVFTASTGIISYYLYQESETIWLPALYHGMINSTFNPCMLGGHAHSGRSVFGPADIGLIAVIPNVLFAAWILYRANKRERIDFENFSHKTWETG